MVCFLSVHKHRVLQPPVDVIQCSWPIEAVGSSGLACRFPTPVVDNIDLLWFGKFYGSALVRS